MSANLPQNIDLDNPEFQSAWSLLQNTHRSVFLTGKAGSGKSTFLKWICAHTRKKHVVLAPTGIAAVNVGGQTLHSFFKIPFKPLVPDDPDYSARNMQKTQRYPKDKVKLLKELELIIIDEISMVRADIIDFIDKVLRIYSRNMREPFGGKQLLFVGDIFQLEPVVTRDMRDILKRWYPQFFFFNAHVFDRLGLVPIELRKIYRQTDGTFISLLDRVRESHATWQDMAALNSRCVAAAPNTATELVMTLATRRDTVDAINTEHMAALTTPEFTYVGEITGNFPAADLPTAQELVLKVGAQIIFIKNDQEGNWVNGTIARVSDLASNRIEVVKDDGEVVSLEPEMWENVQYSYDEREKKVIEVVQGTFKQYPIKPAWALTVHKSQGLTFGKVIIDFAGGAFTSGQTYVALSRCTSLEGISLLRPLSQRDIIVSTAVTTFARQFNNQAQISHALAQEKARALYRRAIHALEHSEFRAAVDSYVQAKQLLDVSGSPAVQRLAAVKLGHFGKLEREIARLNQVIDGQNQLLRELAQEYTQMGDQSLGFGDLVSEGEVPYGTGHGRLDSIAIKSAMANYDKALRICPNHMPAMIGKARLLVTIDEPQAALALLKQAIDANGDSCDAHMAMAEIHGTLNDIPAAIKAYKRAIKADKTAPAPHEALAAIYEHVGLDDLAEQHQQKAQKLRKPKRKTTRKKKQDDEKEN